MFPLSVNYVVYMRTAWSPVSLTMSSALPPISQRIRSFSLSIGQLTFGSFLLVLAVITVTSIASVIAIRHIDTTFAELQRLQSVGDLAEDIDRRMNELRLAARDFVTDPGAQSDQVGEAASALNDAPEEDPARARARAAGHDRRRHRSGLRPIATASSASSALIDRRAELLAALPPLRERFDAAIADGPDRAIATSLFRAQNRIASALLAHDPSAAEQAAQSMRALTIDDPTLRAAVDDYADAIIAIAVREGEIADLDKEVLGTEGRLIGRVTELLREVSARRGRVLSRDFARTLAEAKWQSIVLGTDRRPDRHCSRRCSWCAAPCGRSRRSRRSIRALAGGEKDTSIPATDVDNEIGDIARAAEVFRRTLVDADAAREAAVRALAEQRLAEESYRKLFEGSVDGIYVTTPAGALLNANPALARMMGYDTPAGADRRHRRHRRNDLRPSGGARGIPAADAARRHGARVRVSGARSATATILWLSDSATVVRDEAGEVVRYEGHGARHHRPEARRRRDRRRPAAAAAGDRHRARGHQRQGQASCAMC